MWELGPWLSLRNFTWLYFIFAIPAYNASKKRHYYIVLHFSSIISLLLVLYVVKYTPFAIIPYPNAWKMLNRPRHLNFIREDPFKFRLWTYLYASLQRGKVCGQNFRDLTFKVPHTFVKHWAKFPSVSGAVFFSSFLQSSLWGHICTACGAQLAKT